MVYIQCMSSYIWYPIGITIGYSVSISSDIPIFQWVKLWIWPTLFLIVLVAGPPLAVGARFLAWRRGVRIKAHGRERVRLAAGGGIVVRTAAHLSNGAIIDGMVKWYGNNGYCNGYYGNLNSLDEKSMAILMDVAHPYFDLNWWYVTMHGKYLLVLFYHPLMYCPLIIKEWRHTIKDILTAPIKGIFRGMHNMVHIANIFKIIMAMHYTLL